MLRVAVDRLCLNQLLYCGVMETVRIRREGFPYRQDFALFWELCQRRGYDRLAPPGADARGSAAKCSAVVLRAALPDDAWQLGRTKVFLKDGALAALTKQVSVPRPVDRSNAGLRQS